MNAVERQHLRVEVPQISPAGTGLWENYSFIYSDDQLKAELTVSRTLRPEPEPDALFRIREYANDAFCQPAIAEAHFLFLGAAVFMMETLRAFVSGFMDRCARNAMHKVI